MARHSICLITGHDADLLTAGVELKCKDHSHIDLEQAQLMVSGTGMRPWLDPDFDPKLKNNLVTERFRPVAVWAVIPCEACDAYGTLNGKKCEVCKGQGRSTSAKYLVRFSAREWQCRGGSLQYLLPGSTKQQRKHSRTHLQPRSQVNRTGFRVSTRKVDLTIPPQEIARAICRPSLMRKRTA